MLPNASPEAQTKEGNKLKKRFLKSLPALKMLIDAVKAGAKRGWLKGLDGRQVFVRSEHAALNTLLQSAGALICKRWLIAMEDLLTDRGYTQGWKGDYVLCAWVHDEAQIAVTNSEMAEVVGRISQEAMTVTEQDYAFRCPLAADYSIGTNWSETH